jgi:hypothetical protein
LPLIPPTSTTFVPPGFSTNVEQAIAAAKASPTMQSIHRREHPLLIVPYWWAGRPTHWFIEFWHKKQYVAEVNVSPDGRVIAVYTGPLASTVYARGHFARVFDSPWVVVPFTILFLLPFLDPRRLRRMLHFDALVLGSLMLSYWLFDHGHLEAAVWLVYPPLLYLVGRMLFLAARGARRGRLAPLFSTRALWIGLLALAVARTVLSLVGPDVIDVGFASVLGGNRIILGLSPYWTGAHHADTYGPITYLAYVPFEFVFGWNGTWDSLVAARAAALFFDLVTIAGLVLVGRRLQRGGDPWRLGLTLGWAWAACPFTLLNLMMHSNDGLIALLSVLSLLVFASPAGRGAVLGLAAAAKFSPAALLPLYAGHKRSRKDWIVCMVAFAMVVAVAVGLYLPSGGIGEFWRETIGYQLTRTDVFSPWALHPTLAPLKVALEVAAVLLALIVGFWPHKKRRRSLSEMCALAAAVTIAVQVPAVHWFYFYIVWFIPFVVVALLAPAAKRDPEAPEPALDEWATAERPREPELATA